MTPNLPTLPAGWIQKTVGEISKIQSGFAVNKKNEIENGYVHLRTHNISTSGKLNFDYLVKVENSMIKANCSSLKKDDILFNNTNSTELVGKTALVDQDYSYAFSNHLTKIELDKNIALPSFFVYYFMDLFTKGYFVSICNKWIGQSGVNTTMLKEITIPLPPLEEQKRLVSLLDTLFAKIDRSLELLSENITAADALLPSALNTVFGELRENYAFETLETFAKTTSGGTPSRSKKEFWNGKIPWLKSGELNDDVIIEAEEYITEEGMKGSSAKLFPKGTLLMAMYGATAGRLGFLNFDSTTNQAVCAIFNDENKNNSKYLYYFLLKERKKIIEDSFGGAQPNISQNYIRNLEIPLPPLDIQTQTVAYLDSIREKVEMLKKAQNDKKARLIALKASILDRAFKGEL